MCAVLIKASQTIPHSKQMAVRDVILDRTLFCTLRGTRTSIKHPSSFPLSGEVILNHISASF